jgi:hypothetical protein
VERTTGEPEIHETPLRNDARAVVATGHIGNALLATRRQERQREGAPGLEPNGPSHASEAVGDAVPLAPVTVEPSIRTK